MRHMLLALIRLYQATLSPWTRGACRHVPSCSAYAEEAIRLHGAWHGGRLAVSRLLRCNPLGSHGYDPVPAPAARPLADGRLER
jgi:hypothetical protein